MAEEIEEHWFVLDKDGDGECDCAVCGQELDSLVHLDVNPDEPF